MAEGKAPGETALNTLLSQMCPQLHPEAYIFVQLPASATLPALPSDVPVDMLYRERESWTLITTRAAAAAVTGGKQAFPCRKITLEVQSSLDAVGFLARITTALAQRADVGVNPVSAFLHDHLYVPEGSEEAVMRVLEELIAEAGEQAT